MTRGDTIEVAKDDLLTAWAVLENLAVSLDHMGSVFSEEKTSVNASVNQGTLQEALAAYLTPNLVKGV